MTKSAASFVRQHNARMERLWALIQAKRPVNRGACPKCPHCIAVGAFGLIDAGDPALR